MTTRSGWGQKLNQHGTTHNERKSRHWVTEDLAAPAFLLRKQKTLWLLFSVTQAYSSQQSEAETKINFLTDSNSLLGACFTGISERKLKTSIRKTPVSLIHIISSTRPNYTVPET